MLRIDELVERPPNITMNTPKRNNNKESRSFSSVFMMDFLVVNVRRASPPYRGLANRFSPT
jgi:hypothetical protein